MSTLLLVGLLVICLITDLRERKIYNIVLIPALVLGISYNLITAGWMGLWQSLLGLLIGLGILIIPFALGGMGGGDVKLLAVIGVIKGPIFVIYTTLGMGLAGGIIAIFVLIFKGQFLSFILDVLRGLWLMLISGFKVINFDLKHEKTTIPYGLAISIGAMGALWWMR